MFEVDEEYTQLLESVGVVNEREIMWVSMIVEQHCMDDRLIASQVGLSHLSIS